MRSASSRSAGLLALALELLQAAAVVAGEGLALVAIDRDLAEALAQPLGVAMDGFDALQRRGQLGARGLELAVVLALDALQRGAQLAARGLGLFALAVDPRQRGPAGLLWRRRVVASALRA